MPGMLEVLAFLQESTARMHQIAGDQKSSISGRLRIIADDIANEAAQLEAELIEAGLLDAGLAPGPMRN